jgi:hypothetical protein
MSYRQSSSNRGAYGTSGKLHQSTNTPNQRSSHYNNYNYTNNGYFSPPAATAGRPATYNSYNYDEYYNMNMFQRNTATTTGATADVSQTPPKPRSSLMNTSTKKSTPYPSNKKSVKIATSKTKAKDDPSLTRLKEENEDLKKQLEELTSLTSQLRISTENKDDNAPSAAVKPDGCISGGCETPAGKKETSTMFKSPPMTPQNLCTPLKDMNRNDRKWLDMYGQLVEYQRQHKHTMVPVKWPGLGTWVSRQRRAYKEGKMSEDRKALLQEIDFVWVAV